MSGTGSSLNLTGSCYGASFTSNNSHNSPSTPRTIIHHDSSSFLSINSSSNNINNGSNTNNSNNNISSISNTNSNTTISNNNKYNTKGIGIGVGGISSISNFNNILPNNSNNVNNQQQQQQQQHQYTTKSNIGIIEIERSSNSTAGVSDSEIPIIGLETLMKDTMAFPLPFLNKHDSESQYQIDIENPSVWNNCPIETDESGLDMSKDNIMKKPSFISKYRSKIPNHLELEYLSHHFYSSINLLRATNLMGIIAIIYDGFQAGTKTNIELILIRVVCLLMLFTSIVLSFFKNKIYYRRSYIPMFIIAYTAFYLTFMLEYISTLTTLVLFLYAVLFCSLYALGCLMIRWIVLLNVIVGIMFIIFLLTYQVLDTNNLISYIIYIVLILLLGGSYLFVLEQSRKDGFLDSKNLQKKTESLRLEKARSDQLLSNILPEFVIRLINDQPKGVANSHEQMISKDFPNCSLLYCDIVDFTNLASKVKPSALVRLLNEVFSEFDRVVEENNCEKIKTDGDAYLCAGGLTIENENHFHSIIESALAILNLKILKENCLNVNIRIRVGVASGSVIGGVIGCEKFQFDLWGEAIAKAHVLEETGQPGKIHLSKSDLNKLNKDIYNIESNNETLGEQTFFIIPDQLETVPTTPATTATAVVEAPSSTTEVSNMANEDTILSIESIPPYHHNNSKNNITTNNSDISIPMETIIDNSTTTIFNINNQDSSNASMTTTVVTGNHMIDDNSGNSCGENGGEMADTNCEVDNGCVDGGSGRGRSKKKRIGKAVNDFLTRIGIKWNGTDHYSLSETLKKDLSDVEKLFKDHTKFNRWLVQFGNWKVEKAYHHYVIENTLVETRIFLFFGVIIHCIFFIDDRLMFSRSVYHADVVYLIMLIIFAFYIVISFTRAFSKPIVYQISFLFLLIIFCICTIIEFIRYGNPLARSSLTRVLLTLLYANLFYSLNFVFVTLLNILVFGFFLLCAYLLEPKRLPNHIYPTDYIGGLVVLIIQIYSSYIMKLGMRRIWILKSKIKYKGLNLKSERLKSSRLLENIMPDVISKQLLKQSNNNRGSRLLIAQNYNKVAVMFINIVGFDQLKLPSGSTLLKYMNYIFTVFDSLLGKYDLEKIKTIGTTYMVVAGLTKNQGQLPKHYVGNIADMALMAKAFVRHINSALNVQIGINYGCCVAGCIGIRRAKFDVWGDTANIASRMQTSTPPGKIQVTSAVSNLLHEEFFIEERGIIPVKGRGEMSTYYLSGRRQTALTYNANTTGSNTSSPNGGHLQSNKSSEHLPLHWYNKSFPTTIYHQQLGNYNYSDKE